MTKALSTPAVRHMAKKHGLNINEIPGTGKNDRVTKEDVINFMEGGQAAVKPATVAKPAPAPVAAVEQPPLTGITSEDQVKKIIGI